MLTKDAEMSQPSTSRPAAGHSSNIGQQASFAASYQGIRSALDDALHDHKPAAGRDHARSHGRKTRSKRASGLYDHSSGEMHNDAGFHTNRVPHNDVLPQPGAWSNRGNENGVYHRQHQGVPEGLPRSPSAVHSWLSDSDGEGAGSYSSLVSAALHPWPCICIY